MKDLYNKLNYLLDAAFYKIYKRDGEQYIIIDQISADYSTCEEEGDLPFIDVDVRYYTSTGGHHTCTLEYSLGESDAFNIGVFYKVLSEEM